MTPGVAVRLLTLPPIGRPHWAPAVTPGVAVRLLTLPQCNNSGSKLARMANIGNFLSDNFGSHNVLKCSWYMELVMKKIKSCLKMTIVHQSQTVFKLKTRSTNAEIITMFSFQFMDLNNDVNDANLVPNGSTKFGLSHGLRIV